MNEGVAKENGEHVHLQEEWGATETEKKNGENESERIRRIVGE